MKKFGFNGQMRNEPFFIVIYHSSLVKGAMNAARVCKLRNGVKKTPQLPQLGWNFFKRLRNSQTVASWFQHAIVKYYFLRAKVPVRGTSKKFRIRQDELFIPIRNTGLPDPDPTSNKKCSVPDP
jgi:hypothetical protein